jgi:hypothetical protein
MSTDDNKNQQASTDDCQGPPRSHTTQEGESLPEDSQGLGTTRAGPFQIGFVDEVNGPGAMECAGYRPTHHELRVLAQHWAEQALCTEVIYFLHAQTGSTELRLQAYAERRCERIAENLGQEPMNEVLASAKKKVQKKYGLSDEEWAVFERDDADEWERFQDEVRRNMVKVQAAEERALHRAAAQIVIGYRSEYGRPSAVYVEEGPQATARTQIDWVGADPGRTDAIMQSMLAGPLAEARLLASQAVGDTLDFDLSSSAENLLVLREDQDLVDVAFLHQGQPQAVPVEAAPFRTGLELLQGLLRQGGTAASRVLEQLRHVRQRLNDPRLWADISHVVKQVQKTAPSRVWHRGVADAVLAQMMTELDQAGMPGPAAPLHEDDLPGELPDDSTSKSGPPT